MMPKLRIPPPKPINWPRVISIVTGVLLVGGLVFGLVATCGKTDRPVLTNAQKAAIAIDSLKSATKAYEKADSTYRATTGAVSDEQYQREAARYNAARAASARNKSNSTTSTVDAKPAGKATP